MEFGMKACGFRISNRMEFTEWNTELTDVELTGRNRM